jgi:hypothetical protein
MWGLLCFSYDQLLVVGCLDCLTDNLYCCCQRIHLNQLESLSGRELHGSSLALLRLPLLSLRLLRLDLAISPRAVICWFCLKRCIPLRVPSALNTWQSFALCTLFVNIGTCAEGQEKPAEVWVLWRWYTVLTYLYLHISVTDRGCLGTCAELVWVRTGCCIAISRCLAWSICDWAYTAMRSAVWSTLCCLPLTGQCTNAQ